MAAGALSGAIGSADGGSTPSKASTGLDGSLGCANIVAGAERHDGLLANSSWAARSSAAAPSPKIRIDIDNTIAENRKRKPGSMNANSAFAGCAKAVEHRERGEAPELTAFATHRTTAARSESGCFQDSATSCRVWLNGPGNAARMGEKGAFFQA